MKPRINTLITDLDNTLFDWFAFWSKSFGSMLHVLVEQSGVAQDVLEKEIRVIHQRHGTSEYSFLIQDIPSLRAQHPGEDLCVRYRDAVEAYRRARSESLALYPTVMDTLAELKKRGTRVVGYTESRAFQSAYRVRTLGLDGVIDYLYSPPDHEVSPHTSLEDVRSRPNAEYEFKHTVHRHTPEGELKPNPRLLKTIIAGVGASPEYTAYVGDSLMKDVAMAQDAGVHDVYAEYGVSLGLPGYDLLQRVSHWTQAAVDRERTLQRKDVPLHHVLRNTFSELLDLFDFTAFSA